jgi:hypothetical protein
MCSRLSELFDCRRSRRAAAEELDRVGSLFHSP